MEHSTSQFPNGDFLLCSEAQDVNGILQLHAWMQINRIIIFKNVILIVFIVQKKNSWISHICGVQLFFVINAGHSDMTLTAHGEVIGVGCDEAHFCRGGKQ